ncbi:MAG TPA: AAA family ATPase [Edaphobacter sp.]|nr:AAA family ATPase [Edaphobacter sp.]
MRHNNRQKISSYCRAVSPTLVALAFATAAHAQGSIDMSGATTLMTTFKTTTLEIIREGAERSGYAVEGFAPSSKAAGQLRDAGISSSTLQSFLARHTATDDPDAKHLYMLDESSLASSRQMRQFLEKLGSQGRVLLIGDTRQHQAVEAGRPFQQMQEAGMQTSQLDRIMRQKDPELLKAVEHLARNETETGIRMLADQGRVTEIPNGNDRVQAIARDYANQPDRTIIVSPDNRSRQAIDDAVPPSCYAAALCPTMGKCSALSLTALI